MPSESLVVLPAMSNELNPPPQVRRMILCAGTGCMANGAMKVFERF